MRWPWRRRNRAETSHTDPIPDGDTTLPGQAPLPGQAAARYNALREPTQLLPTVEPRFRLTPGQRWRGNGGRW